MKSCGLQRLYIYTRAMLCIYPPTLGFAASIAGNLQDKACASSGFSSQLPSALCSCTMFNSVDCFGGAKGWTTRKKALFGNGKGGHI